jgi:ABC-2 type transport system permease protein
MNTIFWIAWRELRSFFLQPLAWVVLTVIIAFVCFSFWSIISYEGAGELPAIELQAFLFTGVLFWLPLLVFIPVLSMRLIAEERQTGTLETLLTAPVTELQLSIGKFLAAWGFFAVIIAPFWVLLAILAKVGAVDWYAATSGMIGLMLIGGLLLAVAMTCSALARHQIVAAITGFIVVLALYLGPLLLAGQLPETEGWRTLIEHIDLHRAMDDFARGVMKSSRLIYPISGIAFCLFTTARLIETAKESA